MYIHPLDFLLPSFQSCVWSFVISPIHMVLDCLSHSGVGAYLRVFTKALFFLLSIYHVASVPLRLVVLTFGFSLTPSSWLLLGRFLWMVFRPGFACFCCFAWWTSSTFLIMAIASVTPMFSWLKGAPPGTYPSSCQQKKLQKEHQKWDRNSETLKTWVGNEIGWAFVDTMFSEKHVEPTLETWAKRATDQFFFPHSTPMTETPTR